MSNFPKDLEKSLRLELANFRETAFKSGKIVGRSEQRRIDLEAVMELNTARLNYAHKKEVFPLIVALDTFLSKFEGTL